MFFAGWRILPSVNLALYFFVRLKTTGERTELEISVLMHGTPVGSTTSPMAGSRGLDPPEAQLRVCWPIKSSLGTRTSYLCWLSLLSPVLEMFSP